MFAFLLDFLIPPRKTERVLKNITLGELQNIAARSHDDAGLPYHDPRVTSLVWELKYYAHKRAAALAGECIHERILAIASEELGTPLLIPVPMHRSRFLERGHNQTDILCRAALRHLQDAVVYEPHALVRERATPLQQGLSRSVRMKNVEGSMKAPKPGKVQGRVCIVVDDVTTTGATLREAARALTEAGASRVHTLALSYS